MNEVLDEVKKEFKQNARVEGEPLAGWMLADFGDVIVHIFSPDRREYYDLEELWADAKKGELLLDTARRINSRAVCLNTNAPSPRSPDPGSP